ncbi:Uncharacterised protein [Collinsella intestinalis]|nr:Uncharacterised protein [Collinsella intestinalis]
MSAGLHLRLDRGVALEQGLGDEGEERQHELVASGNRGVGVNHGLIGIQAACQVVDDHVVDVVLDVVRAVAVGDDLVVGDEHVGVNAQLLQLDAALEGAKVVAQVQAAGGAIAGEHGVLLGVLRQVGADLIAAFEADLVAELVGHDFSFAGRACHEACALGRCRSSTCGNRCSWAIFRG